MLRACKGYNAHMDTQPLTTPREQGSNAVKAKTRTTFIRALIGIPVDGLSGFILGAVGCMALSHVVFNNPLAAAKGHNPADRLMLLTGFLGAIAGATTGGVVFRCLKELTVGSIVAILAVLCGWFSRRKQYG